MAMASKPCPAFRVRLNGKDMGVVETNEWGKCYWRNRADQLGVPVRFLPIKEVV